MQRRLGLANKSRTAAGRRPTLNPAFLIGDAMIDEHGAITFMGGKYDGQRIDSAPLQYLRSFVANGRKLKKYKNPAIRRRVQAAKAILKAAAGKMPERHYHPRPKGKKKETREKRIRREIRRDKRIHKQGCEQSRTPAPVHTP